MAGRERAVVADLVGARSRRALVEAVAAVLVVRLPRRVGRLEEQVGMSAVVADDEDHVTCAARVVADQLRDVDAGDCVRRDVPLRRHGPVAAVDEPGRGSGETGGLRLRELRRRSDGRDEARSASAVVAQAVDVQVVGLSVGLDLELDRVALVDADVRGEALDARIAGTDDVPLAGGVARLEVLAVDRRPGARVYGVRDAASEREEHRGGGHGDREESEGWATEQAHGSAAASAASSARSSLCQSSVSSSPSPSPTCGWKPSNRRALSVLGTRARTS